MCVQSPIAVEFILCKVSLYVDSIPRPGGKTSVVVLLFDCALDERRSAGMHIAGPCAVATHAMRSTEYYTLASSNTIVCIAGIL
jgi:hypothetical protein